MLANYGYADASGEYYITIDTDKCNGCGACEQVCPKNIFEMIQDDYDEKEGKGIDGPATQKKVRREQKNGEGEGLSPRKEVHGIDEDRRDAENQPGGEGL